MLQSWGYLAILNYIKGLSIRVFKLITLGSGGSLAHRGAFRLLLKQFSLELVSR